MEATCEGETQQIIDGYFVTGSFIMNNSYVVEGLVRFVEEFKVAPIYQQLLLFVLVFFFLRFLERVIVRNGEGGP